MKLSDILIGLLRLAFERPPPRPKALGRVARIEALTDSVGRCDDKLDEIDAKLNLWREGKALGARGRRDA